VSIVGILSQISLEFPFSNTPEVHDDAKLRDLAAAIVTNPGESTTSTSFDSNSYWEHRYATGGNSGAGSYGDLAAAYKARVINEFVTNHSVQEVAEFGCGDGNNLLLYDKIPHYFGYDVSSTVIRRARQSEWAANKKKNASPACTFLHYGGNRSEVKRHYEFVMSLDVLYHLVAVNLFLSYMETLFFSATRYVLIYATDEDIHTRRAKHVMFRRFTPYIDARFKCWKLKTAYEHHKLASSATFFLYE
jgi:SAM-dependent methyltransferase